LRLDFYGKERDGHANSMTVDQINWQSLCDLIYLTIEAQTGNLVS